MLNKFLSRARHAWRLYVVRDPLLLTVRKWFRDRGDETLRFDYPLDETSLVIDVGGYQGDFAAEIHRRYGCDVVIFEPVKAFHTQCLERFAGNPKIKCLNYGLGIEDANIPISVAGDASSHKREIGNEHSESIRIRKADSIFMELGIDAIDLVKINIEGGEYDMLPSLIEAGWIERVRYVQVQFHNFVPNAVKMRDGIRAQLHRTHEEMWNYEFVWESWKANH